MYPNPERKRNRGYLGHDSSALPPRDSQDRHQLRYELDLNSWNLRIWGVAASGFLTDSCVFSCPPSLSANQPKRAMSLTVLGHQIQPLCFQCHPLHRLVCLLPPRPVVRPGHQPLHALWVRLATAPSPSQCLAMLTHAASSVVGQLLFGYLADRYGRTRLYGIELVLVIVSTIGVATTSNGYGDISFLALFTWVSSPPSTLLLGLPCSVDPAPDRTT